MKSSEVNWVLTDDRYPSDGIYLVTLDNGTIALCRRDTTGWQPITIESGCKVKAWAMAPTPHDFKKIRKLPTGYTPNGMELEADNLNGLINGTKQRILDLAGNNYDVKRYLEGLIYVCKQSGKFEEYLAEERRRKENQVDVRVYETKEVSEMLKVSTYRVRELSENGHYRRYKVKNRSLYDADDVDAYVKELNKI